MSFKNKIRSFLGGSYCISLLHCVESAVLPKIRNDEKAALRNYKKQSGKTINLENPITFSKKNNWYKLHVHNPLMAQCADKVEVRSYVRSKGYEDALNELTFFPAGGMADFIPKEYDEIVGNMWELQK